jgi:hypothetical protein
MLNLADALMVCEGEKTHWVQKLHASKKSCICPFCYFERISSDGVIAAYSALVADDGRFLISSD